MVGLFAPMFQIILAIIVTSNLEYATGYSRSCYTCHYGESTGGNMLTRLLESVVLTETEKCDDPASLARADTDLLYSCSGSCVKEKTRADDGRQGVKRHCLVAVVKPTGCTWRSSHGVVTEVCYCSTEHCNTAPSLGSMYMTILLFMSVNNVML
ncbi:PREDICTED: uncharacterized protein LOC106804809 [Priapulus caudatus]|uniref:Uncharacterized protein LOC106804809 n=1 Tax=Priapulus caudatus TaxID=37621 RepID=A0ABM1DNX3_PRICU|nr:PREDICTED: uncharacterized protein LOC106804809 [Priapulus caudatus]